MNSKVTMNTKVLKAAEKRFLTQHPGGFGHPDMLDTSKRYKMEQHIADAKKAFAKKSFDDPKAVITDVTKLVSRSAMVSMFEKPKFKDMLDGMSTARRDAFAETLYELLHGKEKLGFEALVDDLAKHKLAKWTLATVIQAYYRPDKDVYIKPSTTKLIIEKLELDLIYKPAPKWDFYSKFRKHVKAMRAEVSDVAAPNNAAFCGFLMMSL